MIYNAHPPYDILQNRLIDFAMMQRLRRFAKYWDLVGNSGNFVETTPLLWSHGSPFANLLRFSDWLYAQIGRTDTIALARLAEKLFEFITVELKIEKQLAAETLWRDCNVAPAATRRNSSARFCRPKTSYAPARTNPPCPSGRRGTWPPEPSCRPVHCPEMIR